jgi:DNA-binding SARP family transcriptional activator
MELFPALLHAVDAEPLRERRSLQLMLALYRCGRQVDALREFERCRRILGEGGREPSAAAFALERAIATDEPSLEWTGPESIAY